MVRTSVSLLVLIVSSLLVLGCGSKNPEDLPLEVNPLYSVNIVPVPDFWPREKIDWPIKEPQRSLHQEAWAVHGTPDYIRLVYTFDDRFVRPIELEENHTMIGKRPGPLTEWIYLDQDKVIRFESSRYVEKPVSEELRMICTHGDPTQFHEAREADGTVRRTYTYLNLGKEFTYIDGNLYNTRDFSPAHGFQFRF